MRLTGRACEAGIAPRTSFRSRRTAGHLYATLRRDAILPCLAGLVLTACSATSTPSSSSAASPSSRRPPVATSAPPSSSPASTPTASSIAPVPNAPCGRTGSPPATYDHVVWIWLENHTEGQVIGSPSAPYETMLAHRCGTASHYASVGSPSLPNYIAATSGSTWGIADDDAPSAHRLTADNLFREVRATGRAERSYEEGMAETCALTSNGAYAVKHNPAAYYNGADDRAACEADDVPLGTADGGALARDLATGSLPAFSFITPDLCHDTHDCSVATGDDWLASWVSKIVSSPAYEAATTAVFIVWDEPTPMPLIVLSPSTPPGTAASESLNHYSLLRTTEELLGVPLLAGASTAVSMRVSFRL